MTDTGGMSRRRFCAVATAGVAANQVGLAAVSRRVLGLTDVMPEVEAGSGVEAADIRPFHPKF